MVGCFARGFSYIKPCYLASFFFTIEAPRLFCWGWRAALRAQRCHPTTSELPSCIFARSPPRGGCGHFRRHRRRSRRPERDRNSMDTWLPPILLPAASCRRCDRSRRFHKRSTARILLVSPGTAPTEHLAGFAVEITVARQDYFENSEDWPIWRRSHWAVRVIVERHSTRGKEPVFEVALCWLVVGVMAAEQEVHQSTKGEARNKERDEVGVKSYSRRFRWLLIW